MLDKPNSKSILGGEIGKFFPKFKRVRKDNFSFFFSLSVLLLSLILMMGCGGGGGGGSGTDSDTTAPVIAEVTAVTTPTNETTPDYTFSSDEAGTITYGGSCSSSTTSAISGNNTITFTSLSEGTYSNCTIIVKDSAGNASNTLAITSFEVLPSYVAVGTSGTILTSSDGTSWDNRSSGTSLSLSGVTYGNNKFMTMGSSGTTHTILTSSNGTSWTSNSWTCSACSPDNNTFNFSLNDVTYRE